MMQNNIKVAITGGIGSGKSCVADFIRYEGYKVYSCDEIYDELITDKTFLEKLSGNFDDILKADGTLDKKKLSEIVFSDSAKLKLLNGITHSTIMAQAFKKMGEQKLSFCEVPLLFENGFENSFDEVIVVLRDTDKRVASVVKRDGLTEKEVVTRINSQFNYQNCNFAKYYVIHNNSNLIDLKTKTLKIIKNIENNLS